MGRTEGVEMTIGRGTAGLGAATGSTTILEDADSAVADAGLSDQVPHDLLEVDLLVEDVSIDGMCGVY